jgi:hypothetical protein
VAAAVLTLQRPSGPIRAIMVAHQGRRAAGWILMGLLLDVIGTLAIAVVPDRQVEPPGDGSWVDRERIGR